MRLTLMLPVLFLILNSGCGSSTDTVCPDVDCGHYATQGDAQAAFDADKDCLGELDNDNDGIACEHLPTGGTGTCPTTGNCGCSGKNMSQCGGNLLSVDCRDRM